VKPERIDPKVTPTPKGDVRHGRRGGKPDVRLLGGYVVFDSPDAGLIVSLLPTLLHGEDTPPGLLCGLADARLAPAMRQMHGRSSLLVATHASVRVSRQARLRWSR
jgi:hypothetical protein